MLDCPVSGGEPKAIDGTLSIMCGGNKEIWDKYVDVLKAMGASVVYAVRSVQVTLQNLPTRW